MRLARDAGIEAGVLNCLGDARGCDSKHTLVLGGEVTGLFALQVHNANEAVFCNQGYRQFGPYGGIGGDVIPSRCNVVEQNGLAGERHLAGYAFADGNAHPFDFGSVADLKPGAQLVGTVVQQQNGEDAVMNDRAH